MFQVIGREKIPKTIEIGVLGSVEVGFRPGSGWLNGRIPTVNFICLNYTVAI